MKEVVLGTRGSALALWQAEWVRSELARRWPDLGLRVVTIKTKGDKIKDVALAKIGDRGLFVKELEEALLCGDIDLAVHSMKDMPAVTAPGLVIAAVAERTDPRDVLISRGDGNLASLPAGARLGTSSLRRRAQLWHYRSDLVLEELRGNVPTRLARMRERNLDGIVLAAAGLERLNLGSLISQYLPYAICLPAVGQGAIGVEARSGDREMLAIAGVINHRPSELAVTAERAFLRALHGGCQVPLAALGVITGGSLHLEGLVASLDGHKVLRSSVDGEPEEAESIGQTLAKELLGLGAGMILEECR